MLPRENGAYGQMAVPLVTSFAIAGANVTAVLIALAVVAGFLAHEPLLLLLGRRGERARRDLRDCARACLAISAGVACAAGLVSLWTMPSGLRWTLFLPLPTAMIVGSAIVAGREKNSLAEVAVALTFSSVAVPLCLAAGASATVGVAVAGVFAVVFAAATLAVRGIVIATRGGGNAPAARATRSVAILLVTVAVVILAAAGSISLLPWTALAAALPGAIAAAWLSMFPPPATRLRTVGWTLMATSVAGAAILISGLVARTPIS